MANKAGKKHIVYQTTEQVQFSAPIKTETGSIHLSAGADAWQDDKFVYLKLNTFGAVSEHLLRQPGKFMGPFLTHVSFKAKPISGTAGLAESSSWPEPTGSVKFANAMQRSIIGIIRKVFQVESHDEDIRFGPSYSSTDALFFGRVRCWGEGNLVQNKTLPCWSTRYRKWRELPYMFTDSKGLGHGCVNFTWKWHKSEAESESH